MKRNRSADLRREHGTPRIPVGPVEHIPAGVHTHRSSPPALCPGFPARLIGAPVTHQGRMSLRMVAAPGGFSLIWPAAPMTASSSTAALIHPTAALRGEPEGAGRRGGAGRHPGYAALPDRRYDGPIWDFRPSSRMSAA